MYILTIHLGAEGSETFESHNSLIPQEPRRITLETVLQPSESLEVPIIFHAESRGNHELFLLFLFREVCGSPLAHPQHICNNFVRMNQNRSIH